MKKCFILFLLLAFNYYCYGQNLVINPGAEDTVTCSQWSAIGYPHFPCLPWYSAFGSSDYFSSSYTKWCGCAPAPDNGAGYQLPKSGTAYLGLLTYDIQIHNSREYVGGKLNDTLINGHTYCVQFWVVAGDKCQCISNHLGIYFSVDSLYDTTGTPFFIYTPQVDYAASIIADTMNWTLISGSFTAQGGEHYLCLGNFFDDTNTVFSCLSGTFINPGAYYFIDDVSVTDCTVGISEIEKIKFSLSPNPVKDVLNINLDFNYAQDFKLQVINVLGSAVMQKNYKAGVKPKEIDVSKLPQGLYFVTLKTERGVYAQKFVKE